jgi:hypothetical protein
MVLQQLLGISSEWGSVHVEFSGRPLQKVVDQCGNVLSPFYEIVGLAEVKRFTTA